MSKHCLLSYVCYVQRARTCPTVTCDTSLCCVQRTSALKTFVYFAGLMFSLSVFFGYFLCCFVLASVTTSHQPILQQTHSRESDAVHIFLDPLQTGACHTVSPVTPCVSIRADTLCCPHTCMLEPNALSYIVDTHALCEAVETKFL